MVIKQGDTIKVEYTGTLDDGSVFDTSEGKEPLEFQVGSGQIIKGFDEAVVGMAEGEEKKISISSEDAYGQQREELKQKVPRSALPQDQEPKVGMMLTLNSPQGQMPATITEVNDNEIVIDLNHPLAGKNLNFDIKVVGVTAGDENSEASQEEVEENTENSEEQSE